MNQRIISYILEEIAIEPLEYLDIQEDLLGSGIVDSMGMMKLVLFLETEFKIKINPEEMTVENFMSVQNIADFVQRLV